MSSTPTPQEIARDAAWLVQALDVEAALVRLVKMDAAAYREASFLDDRMFAEQRESLVVPWTAVGGAVSGEMRTDARWIFHIGHVGSTLVARLLGEIPGVLSVREPRILRDLATAPESRLADFVEPVRRLLSRTSGPGETALVKATSFVSEIAPQLVGSGGRALFMYATPRNYIASILAGANSVQELAALGASRAQRMAGRVQLPPARSTAEAAAAAWACEMTALEAAVAELEEQAVAWADFDAMLADMAGELRRVAEFFGFVTQGVGEIAAGPLMGRYSKALEHEYTPSLRRDLISEAYAANRADIDSALAMLQSAAQSSPLLARALGRAKES